MKGYTLGGVHYLTKAAVIERCRSIIQAYEVTANDEPFLSDLFAMHPRNEQKKGAGIRRFFIAPDYARNLCFWIERTDNTAADWSYRVCLTPPTHEQRVRSAFRETVRDQVVAFRKKSFARSQTLQCAITGAEVTSAAAHIDHKPPKTFSVLVDTFLRERSVSFTEIGLSPMAYDGFMITGLADKPLANAWYAYHAQEAVLQVTSAKANLSQGDGTRVRA